MVVLVKKVEMLDEVWVLLEEVLISGWVFVKFKEMIEN